MLNASSWISVLVLIEKRMSNNDVPYGFQVLALLLHVHNKASDAYNMILILLTILPGVYIGASALHKRCLSPHPRW